jgi:transposase
MGQMGQDDKKIEVVAEYLKGGVTVRELERKYGTSRSAIHRWIKEYKLDGGPREKAEGTGSRPALEAKDTEMSTADVKRLRKELEEARLYNKLLNAMIDIAEEQFDIPIRKKSGAKQ